MEQLFEIGKKYENQIGVYKVEEFIGKKQMKVTYNVFPYNQILDIEIQNRIVRNKIQEQGKIIESERFSKKKIPSAESFYETLGYISKSCLIRVQVRESKLEEFEQVYFKRKGYLPEIGENPHLSIYESKEDKWGTEYDIRIANPKTIDIEDLDFYFKIKIHSLDKYPNQKRIYCKTLGELLLDFGFDLGPNHDPEKILAKIPTQFQEAFKRGIQIT